MDNKWKPCFCLVVLGIFVIVIAWWDPTWANWALTIAGALTIIRGLVNGCCCCGDKEKKGEDICCGGFKS